MNLGKFSVKNPVLLNILMAAILVLGYASYQRLPRALETNISFNWVFMVYPYPGVSAEEIEKNIIVKVEDEISDVDKIKKITSFCSEGQGMVQVQFNDDVSEEEFVRLYQELRTEAGKVTLPDGAIDPIIDDFSTEDFIPIVRVILSGDKDPLLLNKTAKDLQEKLLDIKNVSKAEIVGGQDREVLIEADAKQLYSKNISIDDLANSLRAKNANIPGGELKTGRTDYIIRTIGEADKIDDFKKVVVKRTRGEGIIRLGELATVNSGLAESKYDSRFNGSQAIALLVSKNAAGNTIQIVEEVEKLVENYQATLPPGLKLELANNTTWQIKDTLGTLISNAIMGFFVLILVLMLFLGWRASVITALGIPVAFALTFMFMEYMGESLNSSSLFGLVLVLGMIVDHAIVIIENSYRYRQQGMSAKEAAIQGVNEVILPVLAATGTTVAAFLPLMLLPGIMGKFLRVIPIVVSLALIASTIEALLFLPGHFADWGGQKLRKETGTFIKMQNLLIRVLKPLYKHRYITFTCTIVVILISLAMLGSVKKNLFEGDALSQVLVDIELPVGTSRDKTNEITRKFEEKLLPLIGNGEVISINTTVGFMQSDVDWITKSNVAQISVTLEEIKKGRKRSVLEVLTSLQELCAPIAGAEKVRFRRIENGPPVDKPVTFKLRGDNYANLQIVSRGLQNSLTEYKELYNIGDNYDPGKQELRVKVDEAKAARYALTPAQIGMYIRGCFDGIEATRFFENSEEIDVVVKFAESHRSKIDDLTMLQFPSPLGMLVPFNSICTLEKENGIASIIREDKNRQITVTADAYDVARTGEISKRIEDEFNSKYKALYPDVTLSMGGAFAEFNTILMDIVRLMGIGIFLMYIILGAQFKSYIQPLMMLLTIPFAMVGVILYLVMSGTSLSVIVLYAIVALAGIAVNDSIVLISFVNNLRRNGMETVEAIMTGTATRLRPIILTSVTTMAGLFPMALNLGGSSGIWGPMASTIVIGLLFSTMGTLLIIPCSYGILNDITEKLGGKMELEGE